MRAKAWVRSFTVFSLLAGGLFLVGLGASLAEGGVANTWKIFAVALVPLALAGLSWHLSDRRPTFKINLRKGEEDANPSLLERQEVLPFEKLSS